MKSRSKLAFSAQDFFMQLVEEHATLNQIPAPVEMGEFESTLFQNTTEPLLAETKPAR